MRQCCKVMVNNSLIQPAAALAVTSTTRSQAVPEFQLLGDFLPGYEASAWYAISRMDFRFRLRSGRAAHTRASGRAR
jgi:hypothetical protein